MNLLTLFFLGVCQGLESEKIGSMPRRARAREVYARGFDVGQSIAKDLLPGNAQGLEVADYVKTALVDLDIGAPPPDPMALPSGKTCHDCAHFGLCRSLGYSSSGSNTSCDFSPSRFAPGGP